MAPHTVNMAVPIRRVINHHDPKGLAVFASDDTLTPYDPNTTPAFTIPEPDAGFGVIQIHRARSFPVDNQRSLSEPHKTLVPRWQIPKALHVVSLTCHPRSLGGFHRTLSLDYGVVLSGTVSLVTDRGEEKVLKTHDVIVCRGTNHEWINRGNALARIFVVLIPSLPIVTEDGKRLEKTPAGPVYDPEEEDD